MAISDTVGNSQNNTTNATSYAFGAFTPAVGDRILVLGAITETAADVTISDDQGNAYEQIGDATYNSGTDKVFGFISAPIASAVLTTVTVACTGDAGSGFIAAARRLANTRAIGPIRHARTGQGAGATTPTLVFPSAANPANAVFGFVANATVTSANVTPPASWTEIFDVGHSTPTMGGEYARRLTGETNSSIAWGSTSSTTWGAIAVEIYEVNQPVIPRIIHHRNQLAGD